MENPSVSSQGWRSEEGQAGEQGYSRGKEHGGGRQWHKGTQRSCVGTENAKKVKLCSKDSSVACLWGVSVQGCEFTTSQDTEIRTQRHSQKLFSSQELELCGMWWEYKSPVVFSIRNNDVAPTLSMNWGC